MATFLIWRVGALGDTLLLLPALAAIRREHERARVILVGHPRHAVAALWDGLVDAVIPADDPGLAPLLDGRPAESGALPERIDRALIWSEHHAAIAAGLRLRAGTVIGVPALPDSSLSVAEHYATTVTSAGLAQAVAPYTLHPPATARDTTTDVWARLTHGRGRVVVLHPGSGSRLKEWPLARYRELAASLATDGITVLWSAGTDDTEIRKRLVGMGSGDSLLPACSLDDEAAYIARADAVVSADCGIAHLAALLGRPTVTLFGPTDPERWTPVGPRSTVVRLALPCSPCGPAMRVCPSRICLERVPVAAVRHVIAEVLACSNHGMDQPDGRSAPRVYRPLRVAPRPPRPLQVSAWAGVHTWAVETPSWQG